jgi:hypothetical protein
VTELFLSPQAQADFDDAVKDVGKTLEGDASTAFERLTQGRLPGPRRCNPCGHIECVHVDQEDREYCLLFAEVYTSWGGDILWGLVFALCEGGKCPAWAYDLAVQRLAEDIS